MITFICGHDTSTSGVNHKVKLPRRRSPASYSAQFFTLNFILGMWSRRAALCLFGIGGEAFQYFVPDYPILPLSVQQRRHLASVSKVPPLRLISSRSRGKAVST